MYSKINQQVIFQNLLEEFGLDSPKIFQECYFSYYLLPQKADKNVAKSEKKSETKLQTKSQFGGSPIVPKDFIWPQNLGFPMSFVMQIDLAEIYQFKKPEKNQIPKSGIIYVFWDQRQICDFKDWKEADRAEIMAEFTEELSKLPSFNSKTLRMEKGTEYRVIYLPNENLNSKTNLPKDSKKNSEKFEIAKIPQELEKYIFYTGCEGIIERSLIYEKYSLLPMEELNIPSPLKKEMANKKFQIYSKIYDYWQKTYFETSFEKQQKTDSIQIFPDYDDKVLLEIDATDQTLPFEISLNPDLYCDYFTISIEDFNGKMPIFKLDYNLEIID